MSTKPKTFERDDCGRLVIDKDPDATLDYSFDWTAWLGEDVITAAEFVLDTGLTEVSSGHDDKTATAFVSGGEVGQTLGVTCRVTTSGGRTDDRTIYLRIVER